jgi:integrase
LLSGYLSSRSSGKNLIFLKSINISPVCKSFRIAIVEQRKPKTVKECLRHLSKAYQMGVRHKLVTDNPFDGMAEQIDIAKGNRRTQDNFDDEDGDNDTRSFSVDEMNAIIKAFESSGHRRHLTPIIKFLFWTGCRTGEAVGLKWRDVKWDREHIRFRRSYNRRLKLFKPTKTNTVRMFPLPKDGLLWELMKSLPEGNPDDVVFLSKTGKIQDADNWSLD